MKTWNELTPVEQERAILMQAEALIKRFIEGSLAFAAGTEAREIFDEAVAEMERRQTPWFLNECLWEELEDNFRAMAQDCCETWLYGEPGDPYVAWGVIR